MLTVTEKRGGMVLFLKIGDDFIIGRIRHTSEIWFPYRNISCGFGMGRTNFKLSVNKNMILVADDNLGFTIEDFLSKQKQNLDRLGSSVTEQDVKISRNIY